MTLQKRISKVLEYSGLSIPKFAESVGFKTPQGLREILKGNTRTLSDAARMKILKAFPQINEEWLLTGDGEMLKDQDLLDVMDVNDENLVPLINIDSVGGVWSHNSIDVSEQYIEGLVPLPNKRNGDYAIHQSGDSMLPQIPSGAILHIRKVEGWQEYFGYGDVYVLLLNDTRRITKQILKSEEDPKKYVLCHSFNSEYADEELPRSMIVDVWKVVNVLVNRGW